MILQWNIILLLFGGLQGLLLAFLLSRRKVFRAGYGFLMLYLLAMIAQILFKVADKYWLMEHLKTSYLLSYQLPYLYGPFIYLFARNFFEKRRSFSPVDSLHFLPFIYCSVMSNSGYIYSPMDLFYWPVSGVTGLCLQILSLIAYHYSAFQIWQRYNKKTGDGFSDIHIIRMKWLRKFIQLSFLVTFVITGLIYLIYQTYPNYTDLRFGFILLTIFIYWISYGAISQPVLFAIISNVETDNNSNKAPFVPALFVHKKKEKYANSRLKEEETSRISEELRVLMEGKKIYMDQSVNIEKLAALLNTSRHVLSQVINEKLGQSFYDYMNSWRIEEAKQLLKEPGRQNHKIAFIAYDAGFNSLSTFNEVFKKMTGLTPSQYKECPADDSRKQRV